MCFSRTAAGVAGYSPRNRFVAATLRKAGLGTLLFDLLTKDEEAEELVAGRMRFDTPFLAGRRLGATDWLVQNILRIER
jgi:putative phosphoribosyl transferase